MNTKETNENALPRLCAYIAKLEKELETLRPRKRSKREEAYFRAARRHLEREGELEIDDNAAVSLGRDPGAYVEAWVWIPKELLSGQ